ncbi:hypothetical protein [Hominiventricola filiformis]|uniref:Uncharacterized protein n=1 Tax=Hominiventricola filiformis TaxID=2885352 RepID=A0AAE3DCG2_9FIRM|nr:hypothetical protein [Hominiventricola filiformis]MCC2126319.1 hypothetical protein [Hominiventricola filiformis]
MNNWIWILLLLCWCGGGNSCRCNSCRCNSCGNPSCGCDKPKPICPGRPEGGCQSGGCMPSEPLCQTPPPPRPPRPPFDDCGR